MRNKPKNMPAANFFTFVFFVILFAIFYSRVTYNNHREQNEKRHLDALRHLKASKALKYGSKAVAAEYGGTDYPDDIQTTTMRPYEDSNYDYNYVGDPRVALYRARRRRLALQLMNSAIRTRIKDLLRTIEFMYAKKQKMKARAVRSLKLYAWKIFFNGKQLSKTEIFFKRLDHRMYSNSVQVVMGKRRIRKKILIRKMKSRSLETVKWMFQIKRKSYKKWFNEMYNI